MQLGSKLQPPSVENRGKSPGAVLTSSPATAATRAESIAYACLSLAADSPFPGQIAPGHMESDPLSGFFPEALGEGEIQDHARPLSQPGDPVVSSMPPTQEMQANRESGHTNRLGPEEFSVSPPPRRPRLASSNGPVRPSLIHRRR